MSNPRAILPFKHGLRLFNQRSLHTTPRLFAVNIKPSRKQILAKRNATEPVIIRKRVPINTPEALPPMFILESDHKAGVLTVEPNKAMEFLKNYQSLHGNPNQGWETGICNSKAFSSSSQLT